MNALLGWSGSEDPRISIGAASWAANPPTIRPHHATNRITIGNYCCLGENVTIFAGGDHPTHNITQFHLKLYLGLGGFDDWSAACPGHDDVTTIGNDVWLGDGAIVLSGVTVGDGAAIGARAVVTRDVAPYAIVAGNPAKLVRKRFTDEDIASLLRIAWWNWPREVLVRAAEILSSGDVAALEAFAEENRRSGSSGLAGAA